jgi:hypothetical protein
MNKFEAIQHQKMNIYKIRPTYNIVAYNIKPVPKPGTRYIDENKNVFIVRGEVLQVSKPLVLGLDDWDQGYSFNLNPENESVIVPKGKLKRILPKEEIQEAREIVREKLQKEYHMIGIHSIGMNDEDVLVYTDKNIIKNPIDNVGSVNIKIIEV